MDAILDILKAIFASDSAAFIIIALAALVYLRYVKPGLERKEELEKLADTTFKNLPTREDMQRLIDQITDDMASKESLATYKSELIMTIAELNERLSTTVGNMLDRLDDGPNEELAMMAKELEELKIAINKVLKSTSKQELRLEVIANNLAKMIKTINSLYNLIDALMTEMEKKGLIDKVDRRIVNSVRSTMNVTKDEVNNILTMLNELLNTNQGHTPGSDRFDRLFGDDEGE